MVKEGKRKEFGWWCATHTLSRTLAQTLKLTILRVSLEGWHVWDGTKKHDDDE
jgi:hypothetical protein